MSIWCRAGRERVSKGISFYHRLELLTRRLQHRLLSIHRESDPCPLARETCLATQLEQVTARWTGSVRTLVVWDDSSYNVYWRFLRRSGHGMSHRAIGYGPDTQSVGGLSRFLNCWHFEHFGPIVLQQGTE